MKASDPKNQASDQIWPAKSGFFSPTITFFSDEGDLMLTLLWYHLMLILLVQFRDEFLGVSFQNTGM